MAQEKSNVNNLNGVPNFGHGFAEEPSTETPEVSIDEVSDDSDTEEVTEPEE